MQSFRTASLTYVLGQTSASNCCLVTKLPRCAMRYFRRANAFGRSGIASDPSQRHSLASSKRYGPKAICLFSIDCENRNKHNNTGLGLFSAHDAEKSIDFGFRQE